MFQEGCAKIRLPETYSNEAEAILINSSGGLTGGDELEWQAVAGAGTSESGGASEWQGKLVVRVSAADGFSLRKLLFPIISLLRNGAPVPKVWNL